MRETTGKASSREPLAARVLAFQRSGEGLEELTRELSPHIYFYPLRKNGNSEDDAGEFYLFFLPKLKRLLENFQDRGIPFSHYLNSLLYWNLKSYYRLKRVRKMRWRAGRIYELWEDADDPAENSESIHEEPEVRIINATAKRRFLFLILKNARYLDAHDIEACSRLTGFGQVWLEERVQRLRATLAGREQRLRLLQERRNRAFYKSCLLRNELAWEWDETRRAECLLKLQRCRRTLRLVTSEINRIPLSPTHRAIAQELGIPKGTVDTGVRWCKKSLYQPSAMKYLWWHGAAAGNQQRSQGEGI